MAIELFNNEVRVKHFLKADPFGQIVTVYNKDDNFKAKRLVEDTSEFFLHIYNEATGYLTINNIRTQVTIDEWLKQNHNFIDSLNCLLFLVEGYAGCGKTTLVQHILYQILKNHNYEYSYYNYDIGLYSNDYSNEIDFIKYSILHGLKKQILKILNTNEGRNVFNNFLLLMKDEDTLKKLDSTLMIKMNFGTTKVFVSAVNSVLDRNIPKNELRINELQTIIEEQLKDFDLYQLLCIDYLWRLSQYLANPRSYIKYMYVCYDNLDSIMNYDILCRFKEQLITFRNNLSKYISDLNQNIAKFKVIYDEHILRIFPFVIFATYRKITAIRSNKDNLEMLDDMIKDHDFIKIIDVSKQYNFTKIAQRRIEHFTNKLKTIDICGNNTNDLIKKIKIIENLKEMNFVKFTYAGLWNNNFRSCSNVLSEIIEHNSAEVNKCIDFYKKNFDGHIQERYCYYGASSLFLHSVCKLLHSLHLFDENHLDLINIKEDSRKRKTSLSRLIITYISNEKRSVPITDLFKDFEKEFSPKYICKIIGQILKRVEGEIWRRPIYYSKNAIDNDINIEEKLYEQYRKYKKNEDYKYVEFKICDCGETYINAIVPHFEFYSTRLNLNNLNLYCVQKVKKLKKIINTVYEKVEMCCKKQIEFAEEYTNNYNIKIEKYLTLPFHPRTRQGNPQLHIERVIFSHIAYFNTYRMYLKDQNQVNKSDFNKTLLFYIDLYLKLYNEYISKISNSRNEIVKKMQNKIKLANNGDYYISIEA